MKLKKTTPIFWFALISYSILELILTIKYGHIVMFVGAFTACCGVLMLYGFKNKKALRENGK